MSLKIGITGADGLVGWHLRAWLRAYRPQAEVRLATRATFADVSRLAEFTAGIDAIVHCAGKNRGDDAEIKATNVDLAIQLSNACESSTKASGRYPHVVFTNSTHVARETAYGVGKRAAAEILAATAARHGSPFTNLILPHVFGEFGKPFYNSVVSTFCHQLAAGERPKVLADGDLELLHTQVAAARFVAAIEGRESGEFRVFGVPLKVSALLAKLNAMAELYIGHGSVPDLRDTLDLPLFNTLRSYRSPQQLQIALAADQPYDDLTNRLIQTGGRTETLAIASGAGRGDYFSTEMFERINVVSGEATIRLRRLFSDEIHTVHALGTIPSCIDIPTFHTYRITNPGCRELVVLKSVGPRDPSHYATFTEAVL